MSVESESQGYDEFHMDLLIDKMQQYEFLYNVSSPRYKDQQKKNEAWQQIAQDLNSTVLDCQRAWKNLRDRFVKEKNKFQTLQTSSEVPEADCRPTWRFYDKMTFYSKFCKHRHKYRYNTTQVDNKTPEMDDTSCLDETTVVCYPEYVKFEGGQVEEVIAEEDLLQTLPTAAPEPQELPTSSNSKRLKRDAPQAAPTKPLKGKTNKTPSLENNEDITGLLTMAKEICQSITETAHQLKPNLNMKFAEYVAKCLDDLPPAEARKKRRAIMMVLEQ